MAGLINLLRPRMFVDRVEDVDCASLIGEGIKLVVLDLDNTLLPWKSSEVPDAVKKWVEEAKAMGLKFVILSNTHYPRRLRKIADGMGIPCIAHALKPFRAGFRRAARLAGCKPQESAVVGDQLFTDILGGNIAGMMTILVKPVDSREFVGTKVSKEIKKLVLPRLLERTNQGTKPGPVQSQTKDAK